LGGGGGLGDLFGAEAAGQLGEAGGGFGDAGFGLAEAGAEFGVVEAHQGRFGVNEGAFFNEDFGDAAADFGAGFDAAGFDDAIDGGGRGGALGEPPGRGGQSEEQGKEQEAAKDHVCFEYRTKAGELLEAKRVDVDDQGRGAPFLFEGVAADLVEQLR
jgi:hypothetical protein